MADAFIGEIRLMGFNFAPYQWSLCTGQLVPVNQNPALFAVIGISFGGNGTSNFALPNLQGRVMIGTGAGPGRTPQTIGETIGSEHIVLTASNLAPHNHALTTGTSATLASTSTTPQANYYLGHLGNPPAGSAMYIANSSVNTTLAPATIGSPQGAAHENRQPYLVLNHCICLTGIFPTRS